ncbi:MAG: 50S ribosomal protein L18 [Erysipelothrix sp.]|nr:50S ribosomal protein L18 [Erysipelothrix sp.]
MLKKTNRKLERVRRHARVRKKISGTFDRPRLNVFRSNSQIYAQIIDDVKGETIASVSSLDLKLEQGGNVEAAKKVGAEIAKRAQDKKISTVVFDRGGYIYHGRVKALAEAAREAGLEF